MRRAIVLAVLALALPAAAAARAPVRLKGYFLMAGRVTQAYNVRGEHTGQTVLRVWRFIPLCSTGACAKVLLIRRRAHGTDWVVLHRRRPGEYVGRGSFPAPLSCGGRVYPRGERVPFTITVTVVGAARVTATYVNTYRFNRTPCVGLLGRDAARYHGHAIPPPGQSAAASARSPAGS